MKIYVRLKIFKQASLVFSVYNNNNNNTNNNNNNNTNIYRGRPQSLESAFHEGPLNVGLDTKCPLVLLFGGLPLEWAINHYIFV